jgi:hypothetical protein
MEAAIHASSHPLYTERYQRTKRRLGRQRGAKVAQIELARTLSEAIWYMLTRNQPFKPFAPAGAISRQTGRVAGASQPPAPSDPGVTVSRHRALLTGRLVRADPPPVGE